MGEGEETNALKLLEDGRRGRLGAGAVGSSAWGVAGSVLGAGGSRHRLAWRGQGVGLAAGSRGALGGASGMAAGLGCVESWRLPDDATWREGRRSKGRRRLPGSQGSDN
jgi:hypothetical protein